MTDLEITEGNLGTGETAKDQFVDVMQDAANAIAVKNKSDLVIALEHARAIASQLHDTDQKDAWVKIDTYERELGNL